MTPDDFLRSMTPGVKQPDGNYLLRELTVFCLCIRNAFLESGSIYWIFKILTAFSLNNCH